jgi:hypothetical protein
MQREFYRNIFEKYSVFLKIRPVGAWFFNADKRADGHDAI